MWWAALVFSLAVIDNISAQDDKNATETQTKLCCPCPPGWPGALPADSGVPVDSSLPPAPGLVARGADGVDVDDCPCRARDADSEGASSLLFPNAVHAFGNVVRPDPNEDSKPLLHPEVDLASSVLETLREATDEEYRDALERDAARAAVEESPTNLSDGAPDEARDVVTIIVSPRDMDGSEDALPEASHVQETRCIHSLLGNSRASDNIRAWVPHKGLADILNLPLPSGMLHRQRDSSLAASNVHESVVNADNNPNKKKSGLKLKAEPSLLNLDPKAINDNLNNILNGASLGIETESRDLDSNDMENSNVDVNSSNDQISNEAVEENNTFKQNDLDNNLGSKHDLDCNTSPSNNQEKVVEKSAKYSDPLESLLFARNNGDRSNIPLPLKNLLKLRDVELLPLDLLKNKPKTKINIPSLKLDPLPKTEARDSVKLPTRNLFVKPSNIFSELTKLTKPKSANVQIIPKRKEVATDILDAVPSPSDDNCVRLKPEADKAAGVDMELLEDSLLESDTETNEKEDEASELLAKATDLSDSNTAEDVQLKSSEIFQDEEVESLESIQIIDDTQSAVQENDSNVQIISQEDIDDLPPGSVDLSDVNEAEDRSNNVPVTVRPLRTLEEIRKSVVDKLEALQKSNRNALDSIKHKVEEISPQEKVSEERKQVTDLVDEKERLSNIDSTCISPSSLDKESRDGSSSVEAVSFQDLQKMSDSILMASENHEQKTLPLNRESLESKDDDSSEEVTESEINNVLGIDGIEPNANNQNQRIHHSEEIEKNLCPSDISKQAKLEAGDSVNGVNTEKDLEPLASDSIMDVLRPTSLRGEPILDILRPNSKSLVDHLNGFGTKLRQSIVQPAPLINADDLNIFRTPNFNLPDLSGLNANIPTLDEIRSRVSKILNGLARSSSDDDGSSELDSEDFASDLNLVQSAGASSSNPVSIFPPLKPLEDINLDIIQLKPLPSLLGSSQQQPDFPGLNLNRYKAKLAVPSSLDLKPLNLASTLGNNGGLVGTSLTIGPQKNENTGKVKVKSNKNAEFVKSRGAFNINPTLADVTSTMHKNALNLLNIPKSTKNPTLKASNVVGNLAEKIKSHAEDTVRSIHETLYPSASDNVLKSPNNLLISGRSSLQNKQPQIESVVDNLRSQTQNTMKQLHNTLNSPRVASNIRKNTNSILKSSKNSLDAAVDNLKAQSDNTFKNMKQTLATSRLSDISDSIHKSAQNILKSSAAITPTQNLLGSKQAIPTIDEVAGNLRSNTGKTLKNIQQSLNKPSLSDISTSIQKSSQQVLKSPTKSRPQILQSAFQPSNTIDTVVDNIRSQTQNTMKNIQNSLSTPMLADISTTVQKHAQSLLNSPLTSSGRDAFKQVLQSSSPINLTPHSEQVAKNLQKTLKATLENSPIKKLPPLPHSNDVIQIISDHHEDVNDKLYALHTDLTDRLESIHNEVTDPQRLRSILSPPINRNFELFAIPLPISSRSALNAPMRVNPTLQAKQPAVGSHQQPKKTTYTASRSRTEIAKPNSIQVSKGRESKPSKSFRMPSAASSPIPTRIERPKLSSTPKKPIKTLQDLKKPVLPTMKPLTKNKVTITFGSTTERPTLLGKSKGVATTTAKPKVTTNKFKPKPLVRQPTPWHGKGEARNSLKKLGEPVTSPTKAVPKSRTPLKTKLPKPMRKETKAVTIPRLSQKPPKLKSQSAPSKPNLKTPPTQGRASAPSLLNTPKSPLLTKLTDALKTKPSLNKLNKSPRANGGAEMAPAASERMEKIVALDEPMKENVSYKCKMMCVKVDLNDE